MPPERRNFVRIPCELPSTYKDLNEKGFSAHSSRFAMIRDISQGGVKIRIQEFISLADNLLLSLNLPRGKSYEVRVKPAWISELPHYGNYEVGVSFVELNDEAKCAIRNYQMEWLTS